ncbi:hypothetical protein SAMN05421803_104244 [Nocardiopsis flavescens]|uniref:Uncharacterized protein n=1 Tax=Nocardiopsis flavescens TaxID=758803 RepID=A0A1M6HNM5_9ACTN|nr:hypothetical protein SAMN05421803_104244 [Nocardiopsis flavescens]
MAERAATAARAGAAERARAAERAGAEAGPGRVADVLVVRDRAGIEAWARARGAVVRQVEEDWESITYEARAVAPDGTPVRCRYRYPIPRAAAMRRLARTYVVAMAHDSDGARCHHVRRVIPVGSTEAELRRNAVLVASALVELERHPRCGATVVTLTAYTVVAALEWEG